jgi:hypothetical protein
MPAKSIPDGTRVSVAAVAAGRILGYKEANIRHHIQSTGGTLSEEVAAAVQQELAALSSAPARLPWGPAGRRR